MKIYNDFASSEYVISSGGVIAVIVIAVVAFVAAVVLISLFVCKYKSAVGRLRESDAKLNNETENLTRKTEETTTALKECENALAEKQASLDKCLEESASVREQLSEFMQIVESLNKKNHLLSSEKSKLQKENEERKNKTFELVKCVEQATKFLKEVEKKVDSREEQRVPEDDDFTVRWKNYNCLIDVYNILDDASSAETVGYLKQAVENSLEKIKKVI